MFSFIFFCPFFRGFVFLFLVGLVVLPSGLTTTLLAPRMPPSILVHAEVLFFFFAFCAFHNLFYTVK